MKKEKYIREIITSSGRKTLRIEIKAYDQKFSKNVLVSDFSSEKLAMAAAKKIRDQALTKMAAGYTVKTEYTVEDLFNKTFEILPVRMKTIDRHKYYYKLGIAPYGKKPIEKITSADIQKSINDYAQTHVRMQTAGLLSVWRRIFKAALMMNISIPDRTLAVIIPECQKENPKKKEISDQDLQIFLDTLMSYNARSTLPDYENKCLYYAIQIMRYCGLRPAECFALTKDDIFITSEKSGYISVNKAVHSTLKSKLDIGACKTVKSNRTVPVPAALVPILQDCLQWAKYDLIFADYYGNLRSTDDVGNYVHRVAKKAQVQFNLYMLRHQFSTDLFSCGTAPNVIRDLMGHESASMSLDYAVSSENDRKRAVDERRFS